MIPKISIVGRSNSGKTTLIEKLISELSGRGHRVATVKHDVHGFDIDKEGKDSWRHKKAGSQLVVISSPSKIAIIKDLEQEQDLEEIRRQWIHDVDIIVTEGYKRESFPKIEINLFQDPPEFVCSDDDNLIAVVAKVPRRGAVPTFSEGQIAELSDFIETRFLRSSEKHRVEIWNDSKPIAVEPFMQEVIKKTLHGLLSTLKGFSADGAVEIRMEGMTEQEKENHR